MKLPFFILLITFVILAGCDINNDCVEINTIDTYSEGFFGLCENSELVELEDFNLLDLMEL